MTIQQAGQQLGQQLAAIYDNREAANIADWVMEHLTGWKKSERVMHKDSTLDKADLLERYTRELLNHKPVQYVLNEAWFCGIKLYVDENVLIPRPETEELVEWICATTWPAIKLLDVGTGSGCIPISIKKKLPNASIYACDVSKNALEVAGRNAADQNTSINFIQLDFLDKRARAILPQVDILVSNPPYVPLKDKHTMSEHVVRYEPHIALFVEDNDPLIFYNALADFAQTHLLPGGAIYAEIHEELGNSAQDLFRAKGFTHTELKKDMQGKERMIRAAKS